MTHASERRQIAAYGRLLWERRLVTGSSGNISVRLAGGDLLVTPSAHCLRDLQADEMVQTDPQGVPRGGGTPTSELPLHVACYAARPDIRAIVHTHPTFCVVCSKTGAPFEQDTVGARETLGPVAWTPYEPPGSTALAQVVAAAAASGVDTILMERHGLTAVASHLEPAFLRTDLAEEAARIAFFSRFFPAG